MTFELFLFLFLGAAAGGFINGLAGTGTALFALGFFLVVLEPPAAVATIVLMSVVSGVQGLWIVRHEILKQPVRLARFLVPGLLGVPFGVLLLGVLDASILRFVVAILLIVYGGYFGFRGSLPAFQKRTPVWDSVIGGTGGVLGGAAGLSGALPTLWLSLRPWSKSETRAVLQPYNVAILAVTAVLLLFKGVYDSAVMQALLVTFPCGIVFAQIGIWVFRRLSDTAFRRLLIVLTLLMGLGVLVSELA